MSYLKTANWEVGEMRKVCFFFGRLTPVYMTSVDHPRFEDHLKLIDDGKALCLDLEWLVSFSATVKHHPSLFQIASSRGAMLIRHISATPSPILKEFLMTHKFIGKSVGNDRSRMNMLFGDDFEIDLEDIVSTRLCPHGFSRNFSEMVSQFVGVPAFAIKDKTITISNWIRKSLTLAQALYAAFDVVALYLALPHLPEPETAPVRPFHPSTSAPRTKQGSKKRKGGISPADVAMMMASLTFPRTEAIPEKDLPPSTSDLDEALRLTLSLFNHDDEIQATYEIVDDSPSFLGSDSDVPDEVFDSSNFITQGDYTQNRNTQT